MTPATLSHMKTLPLCLCLAVLTVACRGDDSKAGAATPPAQAEGSAQADGPAKAAKADDAPAVEAAPSPAAMLAELEAKGDAALARARTHVEAEVITADTLARVEKDRGRAGVGRFATVLDDASSLIEAGRVKKGTTVEINIHAGLGGDAPPLPPADEASADVIFTDASSGRRVARISPIEGALLSIAIFADRTKNLMQWWAQDPEGQDVEIAIVPDPESPTFAAPEGVAGTYALLELGGVVERPLLLFPDGRRVSIKEWLGR